MTEVTRDCFNALAQIRQLEEHGLPAPEVLHQRLRGFVDAMLRKAADAGFPREDAQDMAYAIVALADELVLARGEGIRTWWIGNLLQLHYFRENVAGEAFFTRLEQMRGDRRRAEVLRVYYLALVFGFRGRYQVRGGELELMSLVDDLERELARGGDDLETLSPHGERPADALARAGRRGPLVWIAGGALALSLLLYVGLRVSLGVSTGDLVQRMTSAETR